MTHLGGQGLPERVIDWHVLGPDIKRNDGVETGVLDQPLNVYEGRGERPQVDRQQVVLQGQAAGEVLKRVRKVTILRRNVLARHLHARVEGLAGALAHETQRGVDPAARLEHVPQVVVVGGRYPAQPLVKLEVGDREPKVQRRIACVGQGDGPLGADDHLAIGPASVLDREQVVFEEDQRGEVIDRERQFVAIPNAFAQAGLHAVHHLLAGRCLGIVAEVHELEVDNTPIERERPQGRPGLTGNPPAQRLRQGEADELSFKLQTAGVQVERALDADPVKTVAAGRSLESVEEFPGRLDLQRKIVQNRRPRIARTRRRLRQRRRQEQRGVRPRAGCLA